MLVCYKTSSTLSLAVKWLWDTGNAILKMLGTNSPLKSRVDLGYPLRQESWSAFDTLYSSSEVGKSCFPDYDGRDTPSVEQRLHALYRPVDDAGCESGDLECLPETASILRRTRRQTAMKMK